MITGPYSTLQEIEGDALHTRIWAVWPRPMAPWQHVAGRRAQSLCPKDRGGVKDKAAITGSQRLSAFTRLLLVLRRFDFCWIEDCRSPRLSLLPDMERLSRTDDLQTRQRGRVSVELPSNLYETHRQ